MIDVMKQQFKEGMVLNDKLNLTREFLQILCLKIMADRKMFERVAFVGGTSLRILFDLKRFSEDLDFSLTRKDGYDFAAFNDQLSRDFYLYGLPIETKVNIENTVQSSMIKFPGLLKELGLSPLASQKLSIKVEVDGNPPDGWTTAWTVLNKHFMFPVTHYDLPSLFAGKLHACLFRKYTKGRDFYDLLWYLTKKIKPNYLFLNKAILQTQGRNLEVDEGNLKDMLLSRLKDVDFVLVKKDIEKFIERREELVLLNLDTLEQMVRNF